MGAKVAVGKWHEYMIDGIWDVEEYGEVIKAVWIDAIIRYAIY